MKSEGTPEAMPAFTIDDLLGWVIAGLIGFAITAIGTYFMNRRSEPTGDYEMWADVVPWRVLTPVGSELSSKIEHTVNGRTVQHPYLVDFYVWVAGNKDIPETAFHDQEPITVKIGCPVADVEVVDSTGEVQNFNLSPTAEPAELLISPGLLRRGTAVHYRLITDGKAALPDFKHKVANLEHSSFIYQWRGNTPRRSRRKMTGIPLLLLGLVAFIVLIGYRVIAGPVESTAVAALSVFGPFITAGVGVAMLLSLDSPSKRAVRALKVLRKSLRRRVLDWSRTNTDIGPRVG